MRRFVILAVLGLVTLSPALADVRIVTSTGGAVGTYLDFFAKVRRSGGAFR